MTDTNQKSNFEEDKGQYLSLSENFLEETTNTKSFLNLDPDLQEKLKEIPGALEYIEKLHRIFERQLKKIIKWKNKAKQILKKVDIATQTDTFQFVCDKNESLVLSQDLKSISEDIKEAAEIAVKTSGFVYEETSGMYYDYNSGYYYNAEYGLYYDGNTGTYLKYNQETNNYEFHSQISSQTNTAAGDSHKKKAKRKPDSSRAKVNFGDLATLTSSFDKMRINNLQSIAMDILKQWPPCMRIIVESTEVPKIKAGSLHIITCDGGSIGREGKHSIILNDINVSKHHLKILFDKDLKKYLVYDLGSRNGTWLNGKRMSSSKQESDPMEISHGSKIQIGSTVLLCHVHAGSQTCGHCEPGLLIQNKKEVCRDTVSMSDKHKSELKKLKKQHGFLGFGGDDTEIVKLADGYTDRAQKRRETVGSQNPYEKTQSASIDERIPSENKGFKLLKKMGWQEGQSLGKEGDGLAEPVKVISNRGTTGMGAETIPIVNSAQDKKLSIWKKTQERFEKLPAEEECNDVINLC
ncbi:angiogenic factor with G patch and FHA domains 1 isoform X2 [Cylas formicarius]|uniref:angiogenic factor with G patch and FHA domains 1 isoform X2 n=1 Tax=Cylas formicarius TaxID=197179 RepID=UPI002958B427|nr:angiogenic factor with G patch and FHA domains 1 isoform X2 [Cylas formicarius]